MYQATQRGEVRTVRKLQSLLSKSWYARLLAVRRVTQDNKGRHTAGIDGKKSLTPPQRWRLARELRLDGKATPLRRMWIPKRGTAEKRPLGIPTQHERARQTLVRQALELAYRPDQATQRGEVRTVRKLQSLLSKSWYARLLAVRRVTQDNKGRHTAGIDGKKSLTPPQRWRLARELRLDGKATPLRRMWIPKRGTAKSACTKPRNVERSGRYANSKAC